MVLSWGLLTLSGPKPLSVADVEALPIDIIPIESLTKTVKGEKTAPLADTPAPKPSVKPAVEEKAAHVGDTKTDTKSSSNAKPAERPVEEATPPQSVPEPKAKPKIKAEAKPLPAENEAPAPTTELATEPKPKVALAAIQPQEQPFEPTEAAPDPEQEFPKIPDIVPLPTSRPSPAKAQSAKTNERKESKKPAAKQAKAPPKSKTKKKTDKVAALLNRQEAAASGAKRSRRRAALGASKTNSTGKLSQSEMDALRGKIQDCFNVTAGMADAEELRATVTVRLNRSGDVEGKPRVTASGGTTSVRRAFKGAVRRAVQRCAPYDQLPKEKYETWADLVVNFDVSDML